MKHTESQLQQACVRWFDLQWGKLYNRTVMSKGKPVTISLLYAVPNGGKRGKIEAAIMKGEGVRPGVSDLVLAVPSYLYHGLYIELKTDKGVVSETQKAFGEMVKSMGYRHEVIRSLEQFVEVVNEYLK